MSEPTDLIVVQKDGSIRVVGRGAERRLRDMAGRYRMVFDIPGMLVLRRDSDDTPRARVLMAGEILHRMTVMEIINLIATSNWRGELHVLGPDSERVLSFDQGALKNAQSTHPDDRLGEVLYRMGVLDRRQLDQALRDVTPDRRFGQLVVEQGLVDQDTLFKHLQSQAEQIFYNALLVSEGHYVFGVPDEEEAPSTTLHIPVQHLLMEGVQRVDEMGLFRERIPSSRMCPEVKPDAKAKTLDPTAMTVLAYCDGERTIEDIARETGLGEFQATKAVYHLMQQGQVLLRSGVRLDASQVATLLEPVNDVMRDIFMAAATYGGLGRMQEAVGQWLEHNGYDRFVGPGVDVDGSLETGQVVEAMRRVETERPLEDLHQTLQQLVAYALFQVTSQLPRDQELALSRDVNRRLKAIRLT
ncbi:MAG: DUF4388 domain-containing protein [Myxococcota bacterium]